MQTLHLSRIRRIGVGVAIAALLATAGACGSSGSSTDGNGEAASTPGGTTAEGTAPDFDPTAYGNLKADLKASGATFPQNYYNAAIDTFTSVLPGIKIAYGGGGSGQGKSDLADGVVDFAGSDSLINHEDKGGYDGKVLYFPTVVAPITVSYNVDGVEHLKLDGPTLAKIFTAGVTTWNDPAIAELNKDAKLPATPITVCHRSDASGTTTNFSKYLDAAGGADWTLGSSDSIEWPARTQGASGNGGVAQCIAKSDGAIGYVDLSDAKSQKLTFASIENRAGAFMQPTLGGASAAAAGADVADDLTYSPIDTEGEGAYPITSPTWIIVMAKQADATKGQAVKAFLHFILTDGQDESFTSSVNYAPLPTELAHKAIAQLDRIEVP